MHEVISILVKYGYLLVFVWVLGEQLGLPIPAFPLLLSAGALAGQGKMNLAFLLLTCVVACIAADTFWYKLGQSRGGSVLRFLCRMSLEPDSCVQTTRGSLDRRGPQTLLYSKFVPGLNTVAAPIAGMSRVPLMRFVIYDLVGSVIWASSSLFVGFLFSGEVDAILSRSRAVGRVLVWLFVAAIVGWIVWKYVERRRFLKSIHVARIKPEELNEKMQAGEEVVIIDLRHKLDLLTDPRTLPGALQIRMDELEERAKEIPRDREVILFCT
ncbi:MAG TPA: VTT domain-containing protein [Candidatus Koribacter sp.]